MSRIRAKDQKVSAVVTELENEAVVEADIATDAPIGEKEPSAETGKAEEVPVTVKEGDEITEQDLQRVIEADKREDVIRDLIQLQELDVPWPEDFPSASRLRDNARQAYKENDVRFRNTLTEWNNVLKRLEKKPEDEISLSYKEETYKALKKYVSKMKKFLKRYDSAVQVLQRIKAEEAAEATIQASQKQKELEQAEQK